MQGISQDLTSLLASLLSPQGNGLGLLNGLQGAELSGENPSPEFLKALQTSLQELLDSGALSGDSAATTDPLLTLQQLLGQELAPGGEALPLLDPQGLPLDGISAGDETDEPLSADAVEAVLQQIEQSLAEQGGAAAVAATPQVAPDIPTEAVPIASPQTVLAAVDGRRMQARISHAASFSSPSSAAQGVGLSITPGITGERPPLSPQALLAQSHGGQPQPGAEQSQTAATINPPASPVANMLMENQRSVADLRQGVVPELMKGEALDKEGENLLNQVANSARALGGPALPATDVRSANPSTISVAVTDPRWQGELSDRVAVMARAAVAGGKPQVAEIKLHPANMGPIEIRVHVNDDHKATVTFTAHHAVTREAIENSLPRLREMFNGSGLSLADADVSDHAAGGFRQREQADNEAGANDHFGNAGAESLPGFDMADERLLAGSQIAASDLNPVRGLDLFA